jgi:hypothetical protein
LGNVSALLQCSFRRSGRPTEFQPTLMAFLTPNEATPLSGYFDALVSLTH